MVSRYSHKGVSQRCAAHARMRAFSGDVQARWQARRDRTDADAVHQPRARTGVPNQQFLASTVRAVDGHNRRLAERSRGSDGATGAPRDGDAEGRRSDMLDERLDWAARKAAAAAADDDDDDDGSDASDDAAAARARKKAQKKKLKKEAKKLAKKILLKKKKKKARRRRAEAEAAAGDDAIRAVMGFGGFASTSGGSVDDNRTGAARGGAAAPSSPS